MRTWGLYIWYPDHGKDLIHPDDLATMIASSPTYAVWEVVGQEGPYLILEYGPKRVRVKPKLFKTVPAPAFRLTQPVVTRSPRSARTGVVRAIGWHLKRKERIYL